MKALSVLDEVIAVIRASSDKKDAKQNLMSKFAFTEPHRSDRILAAVSSDKHGYYGAKRGSGRAQQENSGARSHFKS